MDKRLTQKSLEGWWATLNGWKIPKLFLFKCHRARRKLEFRQDGSVLRNDYFDGLFDMFSALLTKDEQMAGWRRKVKIPEAPDAES